MRRKVGLVLLTSVVLTGGVLVYRQYAGRTPALGPSDPVSPLPPAPGAGDVVAAPDGALPVGTLVNPVWYHTDRQTGRRQGIYSARLARPVGQEMDLTAPRIELLSRDGQTIIITAERGTLLADVTAGKIVPRQVTLSDRVLAVAHLRGRADPGDEDPNAFRAQAERLNLDLQRQQIETFGPVAVEGPGVKLDSQDLVLRWNELGGPEQWTLRRLQLAKGGRLELASQALEESERRDANAPPEGGPGAFAPASAGTDDANDRTYRVAIHDQVRVAGPRGWLRDADVLEALFTYRPDEQDANRARPGAADGTRADEQKQPAAKTEPPTVIEWAGAMEMVPLDPNRREDANTPWPAPGQVHVAAVGPGGGARMTMGVHERPRAAASPAGPSAGAPARPPKTEVSAICDRFELLRSVGQGSAVGQTWAHFSAVDGRQVELAGADGVTMAGRAVRVEENADEQVGVARIAGPGDIVVSGRALGAGGTGFQPVAPSNPSTQAGKPVPPAEAGNEPAPSTIVWQDVLTLHYRLAEDANGDPRRVPKLAELTGRSAFRSADGELAGERLAVVFDPNGRQLPADANGLRRVPKIDRIDAWENVRMTGELARSLAPRGPGDANEPTEARPELRAGEVSIALRPATALELAVRRPPLVPTGLTASTGVELSQPESSRHPPFDAWCDQLVSDLEAGEHHLTGRPVRVNQKDTRMWADKIDLHTDAKGNLARAEVPGDGIVHMRVTEGPDGRPLPRPRPAVARWDERMVFVPADPNRVKAAGPDYLPAEDDEDDPVLDKLTFTGNVAFDMLAGGANLAEPNAWPLTPGPQPREDDPGDHLRCRRLRLFLIAGADAAPASAPATGQAADSAALERRKVHRLRAVEDVRLASRADDEQGYLLRRLQVRAPELVLNGRRGELTANGPGDMLLEDYRPAGPDSPGEKVAKLGREPIMPQEFERPSQLAVWWDRQMCLARQDRQSWQARFDPDSRTSGVRVHWRSGQRAALLKEMPIRRDRPFPPGQMTDLVCGTLTARFSSAGGTGFQPVAQSDRSAQAGKPVPPQADAIMPLDDLHLNADSLEAVHNVHLVNTADSTLDVAGGKLTFDGASDVLTVWGDPDGSDRGNVLLTYQDARPTAPLQTWRDSRLIITRTEAGLDVRLGDKARVAPGTPRR